MPRLEFVIPELEEQDKRIAELEAALRDLSYAADTAELLLQKTCPGEAASLRGYVAAAIRVLPNSDQK